MRTQESPRPKLSCLNTATVQTAAPNLEAVAVGRIQKALRLRDSKSLLVASGNASPGCLHSPGLSAAQSRSQSGRKTAPRSACPPARVVPQQQPLAALAPSCWAAAPLLVRNGWAAGGAPPSGDQLGHPLSVLRRPYCCWCVALGRAHSSGRHVDPASCTRLRPRRTHHCPTPALLVPVLQDQTGSRCWAPLF